MTKKAIDLAIVGVTSLLGETLLQILEERGFPVATLHALAVTEAAGGRVEFGGRQIRVQPLERFDFAQVPLALFATDADTALVHAPRAAAAGTQVLDASGAFRLRETAPLVLSEVNPERFQGGSADPIVAVPDAAAAAFALVLAPLCAAVGVTDAVVTVCQPVSHAGRRGMSALAGETAQLLNGLSVTPETFPRQIAFNLLPQVGALDGTGWSSEESAFAAQAARLLPEGPALTVTVLQVPTFFGIGEVLHLQTASPVTVQQARTILAAAPGIRLLEEDEPAAGPTPLDDAVGQDEVQVGRVRVDPARPRHLSLWLAADNLRMGGAWSLARLAERWVEGYILSEDR